MRRVTGNGGMCVGVGDVGRGGLRGYEWALGMCVRAGGGDCLQIRPQDCGGRLARVDSLAGDFVIRCDRIGCYCSLTSVQ